MQKRSFFFSIFILAALLSGCSGQPANAKTLEDYRMPTQVPTVVELTATVQAEIESRTPPKDCPITQPPDTPFIPPAPYTDLKFPGEFLIGTNTLWTVVRDDGVWEALPHNSGGYTQKIVWWSEGYSWTDEPEPDLVITGERLDGEAPSVEFSGASNAYAADIGSAIMSGVDLPTLGCWKITGKYKDAELSFVVWVAP
jgi:hypothetical protein